MADSPQFGGWIKLYRSAVDNRHLQMPDQAWKIWTYLLMEVNHSANAGCAAGEGWITYRRIRESCCDPSKPQWSDHTINGALDYLETHGYIKRIKSKTRGPHRIRVLNWDKYQGQSSALGAEPSAEPRAEPKAVPSAEARAAATAGKQEGKRTQKNAKNKTPPAREAPEAPPNPQPESDSPAESKEPDPESEATQTIAGALYELQKCEGIDVAKFDFGAARRIAGSAMKGGKGAAAITVTEATATLEWGFKDKFWRQRFLSAGMAALKPAWAAWREQGQAQRPQSNVFSGQQQAYEQALREEAASEKV